LHNIMQDFNVPEIEDDDDDDDDDENVEEDGAWAATEGSTLRRVLCQYVVECCT
jgi:hypothetical protein